MREKITFIALISDIKRKAYKLQVPDGEKTTEQIDFFDVNAQDYKKITRYKKEHENRRWAIYCPCNTRLEIEEKLISAYNQKYTFVAPVKCGCGIEYNNHSNLKTIHPKSPAANTIEKRFSIVERKNSYALYTFGTHVLVSSTTNKILCKDIGKYSLYLSKTNKAIRLRRGEKVITVPMKRIVAKIYPFIHYLMNNALVDGYMTDGIFQKKIVEPLTKFCELVESKCHANDVSRILDSLEKERVEFYLKNLFYDKNLDFYIQGNPVNCFFEPLHQPKEKIDRVITVQYLQQRLCLMLALFIYPPFATIALAYGYKKLIHILTDSALMCSLTQLKKKKATRPKEIVETLFKAKLLDDNIKFKKLNEHNKKQQAKEKRAAKKNPTINKSFVSLYVEYSIKEVLKSQPPDSRVPQLGPNFKKIIKGFEFKKSYVNFFLSEKTTFDRAAQLFYAILKGDVIFPDGFKTLDKILESITEEQYSTLIELHCLVQLNIERINGNFSTNDIIHIIKLVSGVGEKQTNMIVEYCDCISMLNDLNRPFTILHKIKTFEQLHELHTQLDIAFSLNKDKLVESKLLKHADNFRETEVDIENVEFRILDTVEKFYKESEFMHHCVKTYCTNVSDGQYIIYGVKDNNTGDRATLSININRNQYSFNQLKTINNRVASRHIIECVIKFLKKHFGIVTTKQFDLTPIEKNIVQEF